MVLEKPTDLDKIQTEASRYQNTVKDSEASKVTIAGLSGFATISSFMLKTSKIVSTSHLLKAGYYPPPTLSA